MTIVVALVLIAVLVRFSSINSTVSVSTIDECLRWSEKIDMIYKEIASKGLENIEKMNSAADLLVFLDADRDGVRLACLVDEAIEPIKVFFTACRAINKSCNPMKMRKNESEEDFKFRVSENCGKYSKYFEETVNFYWEDLKFSITKLSDLVEKVEILLLSRNEKKIREAGERLERFI